MTRSRSITLAAAALGVLAITAVDPAAGQSRDRDNGRSGGPTTSRTTSRENDRERYGVLTENNMFLKDRRSGRRDASTSRPTSPPTEMDRIRALPEASLVLTGVVFEDGDYRAFIEDNKANRVLRLSVGDPIARGKLTMIDIDTVAYEHDGKTTVVNVGTTLAGVPFSALNATPGATLAPGASAAAPSPLPDPNNPNLTLEERMKLRRAAELQKK